MQILQIQSFNIETSELFLDIQEDWTWQDQRLIWSGMIFKSIIFFGVVTAFDFFSLFVFQVLLSRNSVLKSSQNVRLWPRTVTTFFQHNFLALSRTGKKVIHTWKNFSNKTLPNVATKY